VAAAGVLATGIAEADYEDAVAVALLATAAAEDRQG